MNGSLATQAEAFYKVAAERGFPRGLRTDQVAASYLYIACRANKRPYAYLLIDFSEKLGINVYVLGAVFLQLCELLRLTEHPFVQKPVDPSLFIIMFTERLLGVGDRNKVVAQTALRIIASMKRDWMQTGRKPSGLCGAAIYISALSHGLQCSKLDFVKVVHICEATLSKRLIEFENTDSGCLTIEELNKNAGEHENNVTSGKYLDAGSKCSDAAELLCVHKGSGKHPFAHGLCQSCYNEFIELSGGLEGGSDPPAFQKAERERTARIYEEKTNVSEIMNIPDQERIDENHSTQPFTYFAKTNQNNTGKVGFADSETRNANEDEIRADNAFDLSDKNDAVNPEEDDSVDLSDIDDIEVNGHLNNKEEIHFKTIIWEEMNKDYLEEQAIKEAVAAAADIRDLPDDMRAAHELSAAAAAAVAKSRKERQQKRAAEAKNATPAKTATEATRQMLTKKRLSSKINYDVLDKLFDGDDLISDTKKSRVESQDNIEAFKWGLREKENKAVTKDNNDEMGLENNDSDYLDDERPDEQEYYYGNEEDTYDFDDDDY